MFTQPKNKLDLFEAMNSGKIIFVSTAKDLLKSEGSQLLGRFFIAMVSQAALERSTIPEHRRNSALVYVDEAQEYFDNSIETILSQARKYHVGLILSHQTLDQLSPRLRSIILANTSMKCAGGVSAKDARALADELRTTHEFIDGMKRKGPRSEFAVWVKHLTGHAVRLSVPLGFLERQPALDDEDYDALIAKNRLRYCGTLADVRVPTLSAPALLDAQIERAFQSPSPGPHDRAARPPDDVPVEQAKEVTAANESQPSAQSAPVRPPVQTESVRVEDYSFGKGGTKHRYLQKLVKDLAEQNGLQARIEAPLSVGEGQVDVLLERDGVVAAIEISVTTPVEHEIANVSKCLACGYPRVGVVLVKSKVSHASYRATILESIAETERGRVTFLTPEDLPDFIASLAPVPEPTESIVKGYRVRTTYNDTSPEEAKARREALARIIVKSLNQQIES